MNTPSALVSLWNRVLHRSPHLLGTIDVHPYCQLIISATREDDASRAAQVVDRVYHGRKRQLVVIICFLYVRKRRQQTNLHEQGTG